MNNNIKRGVWVGAALLGCLGLGVSAQGASFDCGKAGTKVEHIICDTPEISKLDDELNVAYKAALKDETQAEAIKQAQKQWMRNRNGCADVACVKQFYETRLVLLASASSYHLDTAKRDATRQSVSYRRFQFQLTKGSGTLVCDAYLKRLNLTSYEEPPYCGRPETDSLEGFTRLNRVPLSPTLANALGPIISSFVLMANNSGLDWSDMNIQAQFASRYGGTSATKQDLVDRDSRWARIWSYDPPVDIDNDGVSDNVEVWYGHALPFGVGGVRCGEIPSMLPGNAPLRQPQLPFVIADGNDRLDASKTKAIFGHPSGGYLLSDGTLSTHYRPIGNYTGIFKYRNFYYFDTFFDGWGDFEGKRRKDKNIGNTLAVFLHKDGNTRQVCEYLMTDNEASNEGEAK